MDPNTNTPLNPQTPEPLAGTPTAPSQPPLPPNAPIPPPPAAPFPSPPAPQVFSPTPPPAPTPQTPSMPPAPQAPLGPPVPPSPPAPAAPSLGSPLPPSPTPPPQTPPPPPGPVIISSSFEPMAPASPVTGAVNTSLPPSSAPLSSSKSRRFKPLLIGLAALVILIGGSAAAYVGFIAPNQPGNVLKTAILNSIKSNSISYNGSVNYQPNSGSSIPALQVTLSGSKNAAAKTSDVAVGFNGYGVNVSLEARLVDKNLYVKTGDLTTLASLVQTYEPSLGTTATTVSKDLSNQWIEVDQSLIDEAGLSCFLNTNTMLSQADINLLSSDYSKNDFLAIQKTSNVTVGGQAAEEFQVNIQDNKAASFIGGLKDLSTVKSLESCKGGGNLASNLAKVKGSNSTTPLIIWVGKTNKQVIQMSLPQTAKAIAQDQGKATDVLTLNYNNVSIAAPSNAEPALQVIAQLEQAFQGLNSSGFNLNSLLSGLSAGSGSSSL